MNQATIITAEELTALKADAERYRWLRSGGINGTAIGVKDGIGRLSWAALDAAIGTASARAASK